MPRRKSVKNSNQQRSSPVINHRQDSSLQVLTIAFITLLVWASITVAVFLLRTATTTAPSSSREQSHVKLHHHSNNFQRYCSPLRQWQQKKQSGNFTLCSSSSSTTSDHQNNFWFPTCPLVQPRRATTQHLNTTSSMMCLLGGRSSSQTLIKTRNSSSSTLHRDIGNNVSSRSPVDPLNKCIFAACLLAVLVAAAMEIWASARRQQPNVTTPTEPVFLAPPDVSDSSQHSNHQQDTTRAATVVESSSPSPSSSSSSSPIMLEHTPPPPPPEANQSGTALDATASQASSSSSNSSSSSDSNGSSRERSPEPNLPPLSSLPINTPAFVGRRSMSTSTWFQQRFQLFQDSKSGSGSSNNSDNRNNVKDARRGFNSRSGSAVTPRRDEHFNIFSSSSSSSSSPSPAPSSSSAFLRPHARSQRDLRSGRYNSSFATAGFPTDRDRDARSDVAVARPLMPNVNGDDGDDGNARLSNNGTSLTAAVLNARF